MGTEQSQLYPEIIQTLALCFAGKKKPPCVEERATTFSFLGRGGHWFYFWEGRGGEEGRIERRGIAGSRVWPRLSEEENNLHLGLEVRTIVTNTSKTFFKAYGMSYFQVNCGDLIRRVFRFRFFLNRTLKFFRPVFFSF